MTDIFNKYDTDKNTRHSYGQFYVDLLTPLKEKRVNIFEVGYHTGGSAAFFADFCPNSRVRSIDVKQCKPPSNKRIRLDIISIHDIQPSYFKGFPVDIAVDDGSHILEDQLRFVEVVYPAMRKGGVIVIEDIQDISDVGEFARWPFQIIDLRGAKGRYDDVLLMCTR